MKNKKIKCDIYTRVSTTMQADEGKSEKSVEGRPEFQRM